MPVDMQSPGRHAFAPMTAESELDLRALGRALWRKRWWIIVPTLLAATLAFIAVELITPKYKSEARVLFEGRENVFLRPEAEKSPIDRGTVDPEAVASQVQLVLSRELANDVINQLQLGDLPEFDPLRGPPSLLRTLMATFGLAKDPTRMTPQERVLDSYYDRLNVYPVEKSRVIIIEFQSQDPQLAARAANAVADAYLGYQQSAKKDQARSASQWLAGEIDNLRGKVREAEDKVERFRSRSNLFMGSNNTSLSNQQLGDQSTQLAAMRAQKADAEARARLIREALRSGRAIESADLLNSELIRRLTEQRVTLRGQLAEQSSTLLDGHPRIKELKAQIADLERQIRDEAEKLVRSLQNEAEIAGARLDALSANLDQLKRQAASNNEQDVELRAQEREAKAQRDLLESYLAKYREATARGNIDVAPSDARVISRAAVSNTPAFPKKVPIVLVVTLATFILSSGFITTGELLNATRFAPMATAAAWPMVPASSGGGRAIGDRGAPSGFRPSVAAAVGTIEEFARGLRSDREAGRRVSVIGASRRVGTTKAAIMLARALARDARVILIDLALQAPSLSVISSEPSAPGIAEVIRGAASFGHIITRDKLSSVHLIAAGTVTEDGATLLASQRLTMIIEALAHTYDHVVIDAGAVVDHSVERFVGLAPKALLVVAGPDDPAIMAARDRLADAGFSDVTVLAASASDARAAAAA
jgi:succinoglycan biosynthesis transport protein ExoP